LGGGGKGETKGIIQTAKLVKVWANTAKREKVEGYAEKGEEKKEKREGFGGVKQEKGGDLTFQKAVH